ncbi:MAG: ATP-binding protein [Desulfarculales bacterium]|jgi:hypothetical protein|nr:ATP-binding protein [Desulfarculales bacterium]
MSQIEPIVNSGTAPLANVSLCLNALQRAISRPSHLPGLVCLYGPSGLGKTTSATYAANRHRAYYVEAKSVWTKKALVQAILKEMGIVPNSTVASMVDQIAEQLALSGRPLIVDEMDHIVERNNVELIRDIYEGSGNAILIIGEEQLPHKLSRWERFHGRVLDWIPAQFATFADAIALRKLYCPKVEIADDLLKRVLEISRGSVRRICVNLELIQENALSQGINCMDLSGWGKRELYSGEASRRQVRI